MREREIFLSLTLKCQKATTLFLGGKKRKDYGSHSIIFFSFIAARGAGRWDLRVRSRLGPAGKNKTRINQSCKNFWIYLGNYVLFLRTRSLTARRTSPMASARSTSYWSTKRRLGLRRPPPPRLRGLEAGLRAPRPPPPKRTIGWTPPRPRCRRLHRPRPPLRPGPCLPILNSRDRGRESE